MLGSFGSQQMRDDAASMPISEIGAPGGLCRVDPCRRLPKHTSSQFIAFDNKELDM